MINRNKGFTLMELMVVVAIVGVISAIAYPSYDNYMKKSRRSDAFTALTNVVDREERYYLQNNTYTKVATDLGFAADPLPSDKGYYTVSIDSADVLTGYTATATAVTSEAQANDTTTSAGDCTTMTLDSTGVKTPAACW